MILGRNRLPYAGPPQANPNFRPGLPHTRFLTNIDPFSTVHRRMASYSPFHPQTMPMPIGPAPSVPAPPPTPVTPGAAASPIGPGGVSGFGFGSTGGTKMHMHVGSPYRTMRQGMIPGIHASGRHLRAGVHHAGALIQHQYPFQTAPLPMMAPPPPPPAPTSIKGLMGALFGAGPHHRHARKHRWWQLTPPSTEEQTVAAQTGCETYPPRADGIKVTVCNGRVTKYEDAQGNVNTPDAESGVEYGSGSGMGHAHHRHHHHHHPAAQPMAGFGFPGFNRGFRREGFRPGGFNPGFRPGIQPAGVFPHGQRRRHHWWEHQQPQYDAPPNPAPVPAFGGYGW
jgi:hypothetical protein